MILDKVILFLYLKIIYDCRTKSASCFDSKGIALSCVLFRVRLEHCILHRYKVFVSTNDKQLGFEKSTSCSHAIHFVRNFVDRFIDIDGGSTANLCTKDLSEAYKEVNCHELFTRLLKRRVPITLLDLLVYWLANCYSRVKWDDIFSHVFELDFGVRQGYVLSLFCSLSVLTT